jgi:hypothetical protein
MSSQAVQGGHPPTVTLRTLTHPPSSLQLLEGIKAAISDCRLNRPPPSLSRPSPISYNPLTHDPSPSPPFPLLSWQRDIDIFFKVEKNEPIICLPCRVCRSPASLLFTASFLLTMASSRVESRDTKGPTQAGKQAGPHRLLAC